MKNRLTKLLTTFLAVVLLVGMSPAAASTAYAASWNSGTVASLSWGNWLKNLFGGSNKDDSSSNSESNNNSNQTEKNDITNSNSTVLADGNTNEDGSTPEPVGLSKTISYNQETGNYTIKLEAYATGQARTETKYAPTDIVLVLDQSGSMDFALGDVKPVRFSDLDKTKSYIVYYDNSIQRQYKKVSYKNGKWVDGTGQTYNSKYSFFEGTTRIEALKSSVNLFIDKIKDSIAGSEGQADYRISLIGYSTSSKYITGTDKSDTLKSLSTEETTIRNAVNSLTSKGATRSDYGMENAKDIFSYSNSQSETDRNRVVVMFTDGEPTSGNSFEHSVAIKTINTAKTIKNDYKASVYTVGTLTGVKPEDTFPTTYTGNEETKAQKINRYMHYVSSNYPNASGSYSYSGISYSPGIGGSNKKYYMNTESPDGLENIFKSIASDVEVGHSDVTLTSESVLQDVISDDFSLPEGTKVENIKVTTAAYKGGDVTSASNWGTPEDFKANVTIGEDGKTIKVTNFNYQDEYAVVVNGKPQGRKLIVEIPVKINRSFGGNDIKSNASAGIYATETSTKPVITAESPEGSHPTEYKTEGTEQWKRSGESVTLESLIGYTTETTGYEYKPDGIKNKYVNIVYTITTEDGKEVGTYTIPAGKTLDDVITETKNPSAISNLTQDTVYNIKVTVKPIKNATDADIAYGRQAITTDYTATSYVHIYDTANKAFVIDFGKPVSYKASQVFDKVNELNAEITLNSGNGNYGNLTIDDNKSITYTLKRFMEGIDKFIFSENFGNQVTVQKSIFMVPASSIYYEDNFGDGTTDEEGNANTAIRYGTGWSTIGEDKIDSILGDREYGSDKNYANNLHDSGTVHYVKAGNDATKTAEFEFTGRGIDIYSRVTDKTGKVKVELYDGNTRIARQIINSVSDKDRYQIPVFSFNNLDRKTYTVKITVYKGQTYYLDGVRIYNPLSEDTKLDKDNNDTTVDNIKDPTVRDIYDKDGEANAKLYHLRNNTLDSISNVLTLTGQNWITKYTNSQGGVVEAHESAVGSQESKVFAPSNEVYLNSEQEVTLTLKDNVQFKSLQLGVKTIEGASAVTINGKETKLNSATDMFVKIDGTSKTITIKNTGKDIISLTYLKVVKGK